jgi:hypothetical protein
MEKIRIRDAGWKQVGSGINTGSKTGAPDGRPGEENAGAPGPGHGHAVAGAREVELLARHEHLLHLLSCWCRRYLANDRETLTKAGGSGSRDGSASFRRIRIGPGHAETDPHRY